MKDFKLQSRLGTRLPIKSVSLHIREYQVTLKVKSDVPQPANPSLIRSAVR